MSGSHHLAAIWFADIVGYTQLTNVDEDAALRLVQRFQRTVRAVVDKHDGRVVKFLGDATLAEFRSTAAGARAAGALMRAFSDSGDARAVDPCTLRIGLHVGDVAVAPDGDVYGDGVNVAARLQSEAEPGQFLASEDVWRQLRHRTDFRFTPAGKRKLKGMDDPLSVYAIQIEPEAPEDVENGGLENGWLISPGERSTSRTTPLRIVALTVALLSLAVVIGLALNREALRVDAPSSTAGEAVAGRSPDISNAIAVLPFDDISPEGDNEYFSDGMTEELISALARVEGLRVASRTSAFAFRDQDVSVQEIGTELNVGAVLEGSVRKVGDRLRIRAQLVDTQTGYEVWSKTYDRALDDVFAIQEEISRAIVTALEIELSNAAASSLVIPGTEDLEAYNLYLRGRYHWNQRSARDLHRAVEYFELAIARDSTYAQAYAGLAEVYVVLPFHDMRPKEAFPQALAAAEKAIALDSTLAGPHAALGAYYTDYAWDWSAAERVYRRAIELDPTSPTARQWYGEYLGRQGRIDEALDQLEQALRSDPLSRIIATEIGLMLYYDDQYENAIAAYRRTLDLDDSFGFAVMHLARAHAAAERYTDAIRWAERAVVLSGRTSEPLATLGYIYGRADRPQEAVRILRELEALANTRYIRSSDFALIHIGLGHRDEAFEWLDRAYEERDSQLVSLKVEPTFDSLRDDPRFDRLLERVGF